MVSNSVIRSMYSQSTSIKICMIDLQGYSTEFMLSVLVSESSKRERGSEKYYVFSCGDTLTSVGDIIDLWRHK